VDSKEDWMQKKERNQRRPGSRRKKTSRVEEEEATSAATAAEDGVNSKAICNLIFWPNFAICNRGSKWQTFVDVSASSWFGPDTLFDTS